MPVLSKPRWSSTATCAASSVTASRHQPIGQSSTTRSGILAAEAARREALFQQSVAAERNRGDALSKRFEEALRQAREEPITKPTRDFDLD